MTRNLIKIHGGKYRIRKYLYKLLPDMNKISTLFEPFVGGGSFFLGLENPPPLIFINDLDSSLIDLYVCARDCCDVLIDKLNYVSHTESNFNFVKTFQPQTTLESAIKRFTLSRMSRGGLCKTFGKSSRTRGGKDEYLNSWLTSIKSLPKISKKLQNCVISNSKAVQLLSDKKNIFDKNNILIYLDPPYLLSTRTAKKCYDHEMTEYDHEILLKVINQYSNAKIMISGYDSGLYDFYLDNPKWNKHNILVANNSGQSKTKQKRIECVWRNYF